MSARDVNGVSIFERWWNAEPHAVRSSCSRLRDQARFRRGRRRVSEVDSLKAQLASSPSCVPKRISRCGSVMVMSRATGAVSGNAARRAAAAAWPVRRAHAGIVSGGADSACPACIWRRPYRRHRDSVEIGVGVRSGQEAGEAFLDMNALFAQVEMEHAGQVGFGWELEEEPRRECLEREGIREFPEHRVQIRDQCRGFVGKLCLQRGRSS